MNSEERSSLLRHSGPLFSCPPEKILKKLSIFFIFFLNAMKGAKVSTNEGRASGLAELRL